MKNLFSSDLDEAFCNPLHRLILIVSVILISLFSVSCSQPIHMVKFNTDGGSAVADQPVTDGQCTVRPSNPTKEGFAFDDWYVDATFSAKYDFNTLVKSDFTLYAKWLQAYAITYVGPEGTVIDYAPSGAYTLKYNSLVSEGVKGADNSEKYTNFKKQNYSLARWDIGSSLYDEGSEIEIKDQPVTVNCYWVISNSFVASSTGEVKANGSMNGGLVIPRVVTTWSGSEGTDTLIKTVGDFSSKRITNVYIPSSAEKVNDKAFKGCSQLTTVYFTSKVPAELGSGAFDGCTRLKEIDVPAGSEDAYKENWPEVEQKITGTDEPEPEPKPTPTPTPTPTPGPTPTPTVKYTVTFDSNGGSEVSPQQITAGEKVTKPDDPTKNDFVFYCWCADEELTTAYDFGTSVTADITLFAKWASYITFSSENPFTIATADSKKNWDGTIEYSTDKSVWNVWDGTLAISSSVTGSTEYIHLRGTGNSVITKEPALNASLNLKSVADTSGWTISGSDVSVSGNIMALLDYQTPPTTLTEGINEYCFANLFRNCDALSSVSDDFLPSTALTDGCYAYMFSGCTALKTAPALPATILAECCYQSMFEECTSLTALTIPDGNTYALPATQLSGGCYYCMFFGCTALTSAPALPATSLADYCYNGMFYSCTSLLSAPELSATVLVNNCYENMFNGCSSLKVGQVTTGSAFTGTKIFDCPDYSTQSPAPETPVTDMFDGTTGSFTGGTPAPGNTYYWQ